MRAAPAAYVGPLVRVEGFRGVVCAAFPSSVYVTAARGPMLVVHDRAHGRTPSSVQVDPAALAGIRAGQTAAGRAGHLRVGELVVDLRQAAVWQPPLPPRGPARKPPTGLPASDPWLAAAAGRALDGAHAGAAHSALVPLVGRGPGLTPAGDDALVGVLAVLHRATPPEVGGSLIRALAATLPGLLHRTTEISAHYLRLALTGDFGEPLLRVVDDLAGSGDVRPSHLDALIRTGATSGRDALAGVVAASNWLSRTDLKDVA